MMLSAEVGYTLLASLYLVADLIVAKILAVHIQVHEQVAGTERQSDKTPQLVSKSIADERLITMIGQQCPVTGIGEA